MLGEILSFSITTADTPLQLITDDKIFFRDINIQVMQANVFYGSGDKVSSQAQGTIAPSCPLAIAGSVITFQDLKGSTLWFKSSVNATPAVLSCSGTSKEA